MCLTSICSSLLTLVLIVRCAASRDDDKCRPAGCDEICLSSASSTVRCACPSDSARVLAADNKHCLGASTTTSSLSLYLLIKYINKQTSGTSKARR